MDPILNDILSDDIKNSGLINYYDEPYLRLKNHLDDNNIDVDRYTDDCLIVSNINLDHLTETMVKYQLDTGENLGLFDFKKDVYGIQINPSNPIHYMTFYKYHLDLSQHTLRRVMESIPTVYETSNNKIQLLIAFRIKNYTKVSYRKLSRLTLIEESYLENKYNKLDNFEELSYLKIRSFVDIETIDT